MSKKNNGSTILRFLATAALIGAAKVATDVAGLMMESDEEDKDVRKASTYKKEPVEPVKSRPKSQGDDKYSFLSGKRSYYDLSEDEKTMLMELIRAAFTLCSEDETLAELKKLLNVNRVVTKTAFELCDDERIDLFVEKWYY